MARAHISVTAAVTAVLVATLAGCSTGKGAAATRSTPSASPTRVTCTAVKAALAREDAAIAGTTPTAAQMRYSVNLIGQHPSCFNPVLVEGAQRELRDLDRGIAPTMPTFNPPTGP